MAIIQRLRSQQGLLKAESRKDIYDLTDPSIHGDINIMQHKGYPPPVPGLDLQNAEHEIIATVEAAAGFKNCSKFNTGKSRWLESILRGRTR